MVGRLFPAAFFLLLLPAASAQISLSAGVQPASATSIRNVSFRNATALTREERQAIVHKLQSQSPVWLAQQSPDSLARFIAATVLEAYQDDGYWRARISADATWARGEGSGHPVDVQVRALTEGEQYWVKDIRWTGATVFPAPELLQAFALRPWELLTRSREAAGIGAVRRLYFARGYLAATVNPQMQFDDASHSVSLTLTVEEDKLFHFRNLSVAGLSHESTRQLESRWQQMRDQPYSAESLREFFQRYVRPPQPDTDPLEYSTSNIDLNTHTVDIQISFTPVTQAERTSQ